MRSAPKKSSTDTARCRFSCTVGFTTRSYVPAVGWPRMRNQAWRACGEKIQVPAGSDMAGSTSELLGASIMGTSAPLYHSSRV